MPNVSYRSPVFHLTVVAAVFSLGTSSANAQSSTRMRSRTVQPTVQPRSTSVISNNTVGLQGYCPVCVIDMKKWIKGKPQFTAKHDGKTYLFPGEEQKQMFLKSPAKYTPVLGGDCVVALVDMGKRIPGKLNYAALHNGRLYLFVNEQAKSAFLTNRNRYAEADLAIGGKCAVCRVEMNKEIDGVPEFMSVYQGLRYQFPGMEQQQMFNRNPSKYAVKTNSMGSGRR